MGNYSYVVSILNTDLKLNIENRNYKVIEYIVSKLEPLNISNNNYLFTLETSDLKLYKLIFSDKTPNLIKYIENSISNNYNITCIKYLILLLPSKLDTIFKHALRYENIDVLNILKVNNTDIYLKYTILNNSIKSFNWLIKYTENIENGDEIIYYALSKQKYEFVTKIINKFYIPKALESLKYLCLNKFNESEKICSDLCITLNSIPVDDIIMLVDTAIINDNKSIADIIIKEQNINMNDFRDKIDETKICKKTLLYVIDKLITH